MYPIGDYAPECLKHDDKLHAYLDESKSGGGEIVCSAGYKIQSSEGQRISFDQVRCPKCGAADPSGLLV
jgi:hypothetical protein